MLHETFRCEYAWPLILLPWFLPRPTPLFPPSPQSVRVTPNGFKYRGQIHANFMQLLNWYAGGGMRAATGSWGLMMIFALLFCSCRFLFLDDRFKKNCHKPMPKPRHSGHQQSQYHHRSHDRAPQYPSAQQHGGYVGRLRRAALQLGKWKCLVPGLARGC